MPKSQLPKDQIEQLHFRTFQEQVSELAGTMHRGQPPEPDFLVDIPIGRIGIELTTIQTPRREQEELRDAAVQLGQQEYECRGGPPVLVSFFWTDNPLRENAKIRELGPRLAKLVESHLPKSDNASIDLEWQQLRDEGLQHLLNAVHVRRLSGVRTLWTSPDAGYISSEIEVVSTLLAAKEQKLQGYRAGCAEVWLLVVSEGITISRNLDAEKLLSHELETNFDRIYLLEVFGRRVSSFKVRRPG